MLLTGGGALLQESDDGVERRENLTEHEDTGNRGTLPAGTRRNGGRDTGHECASGESNPRVREQRPDGRHNQTSY